MHSFRRQYAESWRKMQELRAQIQAQLKLADTLRKLGEHAGTKGIVEALRAHNLSHYLSLFFSLSLLSIIVLIKSYLTACMSKVSTHFIY